jgi:hypothetical protein
MAMLFITPGQMSAAGSYISREWGDYGYEIEAIESRSVRVSVFRVVATTDGSRFSVVCDRYGNCRHLDTHSSDDGLAELVAEMHAKSATNA